MLYYSNLKQFLLVYICVCVLTDDINAQDNETNTFPVFAPPLDIPLRLSGDFGELRAAHLHAGLDFRTQGVTGKKVLAVEEGYVSRVSVSSGGYGKAIYINHPGGWMTVYGHLEKFSDKIAAWVKEYQYEHETFAMDIPIPEGQFSVSKGELIGFSGNTGSSGGPHLHFEVRTEDGETPLNPHLFGFNVPDDTAPAFRSVSLVPLTPGGSINNSTDKIILPVVTAQKKIFPEGDSLFICSGEIGIAVEAFDTSTGSTGRSGVYTLRLFADSVLVFERTANRFGYQETRYNLASKDYSEYNNSRKTLERLFRIPGNKLSWINTPEGNGSVSFNDTVLHILKVEAEDYKGNKSVLNIKARWKIAPDGIPIKHVMPVNHMAYTRENRFTAKSLEIIIPAESLYEDIDFAYEEQSGNSELFGAIHSLHSPETPLHKPIQIKIRGDIIPENLREKAFITTVNSKDKPSGSLGGQWKGIYMEARTSSFNRISLSVDTVPPKILPVIVSADKGILKFQVSDNITGVSTIKGTLDGKWVLYEHDGKTSSVEFTLTPDKFPRTGKNREFRLMVTDAKGNTSEYKRNFIF